MIVDLHSDLLLDCAHRRVRGERHVLRDRHLPVLRAAGVRVQVLALFVETAFVPEGALRSALRLVEVAEREAEESDGAFRLARTRAELAEALAEGAVAGVLAFEGVEALGRDPGLLRIFARLGVRLVGPTWNRANDFADGTGEDRGVGFTPLGHRLLAEMEELGLALDLAHLSRRAAVEGLERYRGPVLASHANAAAVYGNARNLDDQLIREVARRDGVIGLNLLRVFLGPGEPAERIAAHYRHLVAVGGPGLPAFGADFTDFLPPGAAEAPELGLPPGSDRALHALPPLPRETIYEDAVAALGAGEPAGHVEGLRHANALRLLERALP